MSTYQFEHTVQADGIQYWNMINDTSNETTKLELQIKLQTREITQEPFEILKRVKSAISNGLTVSDGQMIKGFHRYPLFAFQSPSQDYIQIVIPDDRGRYPWDPECDEIYSSQIHFTTDKTFFLITHNKEKVEYIQNSIMLSHLAPEFTERPEGYLSPIQYIVNNELFQSGRLSILRSLSSYVNETAYLLETDDLSVICKDTDYSDPINKHFKEYKEKYIDHNT